MAVLSADLLISYYISRYFCPAVCNTRWCTVAPTSHSSGQYGCSAPNRPRTTRVFSLLSWPLAPLTPGYRSDQALHKDHGALDQMRHLLGCTVITHSAVESGVHLISHMLSSGAVNRISSAPPPVYKRLQVNEN